jgi:rRNA maturation endonuclease Nob1
MAERRKRITEKLSELHSHIKSGDPIASEIHDPLHEAIGKVEEAVDEDADADADHSNLTETLGDLALNLEVSHPRITDVLNHISELLAGAGI